MAWLYKTVLCFHPFFFLIHSFVSDCNPYMQYIHNSNKLVLVTELCFCDYAYDLWPFLFCYLLTGPGRALETFVGEDVNTILILNLLPGTEYSVKVIASYTTGSSEALSGKAKTCEWQATPPHPHRRTPKPPQPHIPHMPKSGSTLNHNQGHRHPNVRQICCQWCFAWLDSPQVNWLIAIAFQIQWLHVSQYFIKKCKESGEIICLLLNMWSSTMLKGSI